jgi:hypothetical protein
MVTAAQSDYRVYSLTPWATTCSCNEEFPDTLSSPPNLAARLALIGTAPQRRVKWNDFQRNERGKKAVGSWVVSLFRLMAKRRI